MRSMAPHFAPSPYPLPKGEELERVYPQRENPQAPHLAHPS